MIFDRMRVYDAGRFTDTELPDWYHDAGRLSQTERLDWHHALERVLGCEYTLLTEEGLLGGALEIRFWPSEIHGFFVLIETPLSFVEHVIVPNPADWLPFLSRHLAPLISVANQSSLIALHGRIDNAFIAVDLDHPLGAEDSLLHCRITCRCGALAENFGFPGHTFSLVEEPLALIELESSAHGLGHGIWRIA